MKAHKVFQAGIGADVRPCAPRMRQAASTRHVHACAVSGEYNPNRPDPQFVNDVLDAFPDEGVANTEEAMALYASGGYNILDIRSKAQRDQYGEVPNVQRARTGGKAIHVPYKLTKKYFEDGKQQTEEQDNPDFFEQVDSKMDKEQHFMVMDFDGQTHAIDVLEGLDEEGFNNIVGIKGGYKAWFKTWDQKLRRRNLGEYQEHGWGEGRDSAGIHSSGAGFENQDRASGDFWDNW